MPTILKVSLLLFLILLNFACFNRFAKAPPPEKEISATTKNEREIVSEKPSIEKDIFDVAAEELSGEPDPVGLLNNLKQNAQQLTKSSEDALQLGYSFLKTRGSNSDSDGLQLISSTLSSLSDSCQCEYRSLLLYGLAQEKYKNDLALRLSQIIRTEKTTIENLIKQHWLGFSMLESNNAIRLADKAKQQINETQKLFDELIRFYAFEHRRWK